MTPTQRGALVDELAQIRRALAHIEREQARLERARVNGIRRAAAINDELAGQLTLDDAL